MPKASAGDYVSVLEEYERKQGYLGNHPALAPADIGQALKRSERNIGQSDVVKLKDYYTKGEK